MARHLLTSSPEALKAAAQVIARSARGISGTFSQRIPAVIRVYRAGGTYGGDKVFIAAGSKGGKWGWTPIHAWMFEEPHGSKVPKHPFMGNRKGKWYYQPYRPYLEEAAEKEGDHAAQVYATLEIARWARESGYK